MKLNISPGIIIAMLGLGAMTFGLASESISFAEKIPITIIGFAVIILGILIETPVLEHLKGIDRNEEFS